jgi:hypothetical protein
MRPKVNRMFLGGYVCRDQYQNFGEDNCMQLQNHEDDDQDEDGDDSN